MYNCLKKKKTLQSVNNNNNEKGHNEKLLGSLEGGGRKSIRKEGKGASTKVHSRAIVQISFKAT